MKPANLLLSMGDYERLNSLVETVRTDVSVLLEEELARATVVPDESLPDNAVAMNSVVRFKDLDSGKQTEVQVVFPHEADASKGKISVLAPIGAALIGLHVGQSIEWLVPSGRNRRIEVLSVFKEIQDQAS